ncbi:hypothetical protein I4U23_024944 [Adineta vaga]|nr:hypothetical protein I4U23_024944 [Adineta vaga]
MDDENLAEADEVFYENANMIDNEPFYNNFTTIQNDLQHHDKPIQLKTSFQLINRRNYIDRIATEPSHIVESIDQRSKSKSRSPDNSTSRSTSPESIVQQPNININRQYFQNWYCNRYLPSAPTSQYYPVNPIYQKATQRIENLNRTENVSQPPVTTMDVTNKQVDEEGFHNRISRMYGFDDMETGSSASSRSSSVERENSPVFSDRTTTPIPLEPIETLKPKLITIREYFPRKDLQSLTVNGSISPPSQRHMNVNCCYERVLHDHPDVYQDPNPKLLDN